MAVTDLTGTKWLLNSSLDMSSFYGYEMYGLQFNASYACLQLTTDYLNGDNLYYSTSYNPTPDSNSTLVYSSNDGWSSQDRRTIEITGGTDATNANLISWLQANATQITEPEITNLRGTKWVFNNQISMSPLQGDYYQFNFDFIMTEDPTAPGGGFELIDDSGSFTLEYTNITSAYYHGVWEGDVFKSIEITDGPDVMNPDLIAWLQANATQVQDEGEPTNTFSFGNLTTANVYFGTQQVRKIYLGNSLVWEKEIIPENVLLAQDGALLTSDGGYLITTEVTLISFTIEGTSYQAESGMTWGEWVDSSYNTEGFIVFYDCIYTQIAPYKVTYGSQRAHPSDAIIANTAYTLIGDGADN